MYKCGIHLTPGLAEVCPDATVVAQPVGVLVYPTALVGKAIEAVH